MNTYLFLKWAHILSSVLLVGTGFGSAFYLYFIHRTRNTQAIAEVSRLVVKADFWFTTPAIVIQPVTGYAMMSISSFTFSQSWLFWTVGLYIIAGICWLPVVWLQLRMADMATVAVTNNSALPTNYWRYARYWEWLGYPAFIAMLGVYWLIVFRCLPTTALCGQVFLRAKKTPGRRGRPGAWFLALGNSLLSHGKLPHYHRR